MFDCKNLRRIRGANLMASESVTTWIGQLKAGDHAAAERLWGEYFNRLVGLARVKLGDRPPRALDEEDVALSAFQSLCFGAARGRFPHLQDRDNLWRLLATITAKKALNVVRNANRQKRGGGAIRGESALIGPNGAADASSGFEEFIGTEPTPEFAAQMAEEYEHLLLLLEDAELASIARWRMEGYDTEEIASKLGKSSRTVKRKLGVIRTIWEDAEVAA